MTREFDTDKQEKIFGFFPKVISKRLSFNFKVIRVFFIGEFFLSWDDQRLYKHINS